jgi:hypothetical protein
MLIALGLRMWVMIYWMRGSWQSFFRMLVSTFCSSWKQEVLPDIEWPTSITPNLTLKV